MDKIIHQTGLPSVSEKDLLEMNKLMSDKNYKIKQSSSLFSTEKVDSINPEFISYILYDYLGHIQRCVAFTKKILPNQTNEDFYKKWKTFDGLSYELILITAGIDIRTLSALHLELQKRSRALLVSDLIPFIKVLFKSLIKVYYLGTPIIKKKYLEFASFIVSELVLSDESSLRMNIAGAIEEYSYIFNTIIPSLYPLLLRMSSTSFKSMHDLFYSNGSMLIAWLNVRPEEVLLIKGNAPIAPTIQYPEPQVVVSEIQTAPETQEFPKKIQKGLKTLEHLFPEAGWDVLDTMPDMAPYFLSIFNLQDFFIQLAPENPLQITLILFLILEDLFQGLRQVRFQPIAISNEEEKDSIAQILEDWVYYKETIIDKEFSPDLKAYTHQVYTQPDYHKSPYGRKLLANMYMLIRTKFLPYFDIHLYGTVRPSKDERFAPFFVRVSRLKKYLDYYFKAVSSNTADASQEDSVSGIGNPWALYKFDVANPVSVRIDALCGGKNSRTRTNALLIEYAHDIINVLDWWINDKTSYAYNNTPEFLYRTIEKDNPTPAFGIKVRKDIDALFARSLKNKGTEKN